MRPKITATKCAGEHFTEMFLLASPVKRKGKLSRSICVKCDQNELRPKRTAIKNNCDQNETRPYQRGDINDIFSFYTFQSIFLLKQGETLRPSLQYEFDLCQ